MRRLRVEAVLVVAKLLQRLDIQINYVASRVVAEVYIAAQRRLQVHVIQIVFRRKERRRQVKISIRLEDLQLWVLAHRIRQVGRHIRQLQWTRAPAALCFQFHDSFTFGLET